MPTGVYPRRVKRHAVTQPSDPSYRLIPLTQGQNAIVDADDFERLNKFNWCACWRSTSHGFYAQRNTKNGVIYMHREILACKHGQESDHRNHDTLDNRRENLRICTHKQNGRNNAGGKIAGGFKGIYQLSGGNWHAAITINGKSKSLGTYSSPEIAARAYDAAAKIHFGEFACLNFA